MKGAYYNEIDKQKAAWLRELISRNLIAPGDVDERSIADVRPDDLRGYQQCHFFAGIGIWSYALRLAGWDDDREVWTGSCPCQPFSAVGKGEAFDDERHLWPVWFPLIEARRPIVVFGEQVSSIGGRTCSQRWKLEPCEKFINHWEPAKRAWDDGLLVRNAKGIDAGELRRAKDFSDNKYQVVYPLIEWRWSREECVEAIQRSGLPMPVKSACFYCPSSRKSEVIQLKDNHPELFARAVAMEHNAAAKLVNIRGLGRHWSWEEIGKADDDQFKMFPETVSVPCVCFDGDDEEAA